MNHTSGPSWAPHGAHMSPHTGPYGRTWAHMAHTGPYGPKWSLGSLALQTYRRRWGTQTCLLLFLRCEVVVVQHALLLPVILMSASTALGLLLLLFPAGAGCRFRTFPGTFLASTRGPLRITFAFAALALTFLTLRG